jgi:hypothetical protein
MILMQAWPEQGTEQHRKPERAKCANCGATIEYLGGGEWEHLVDKRKSCSI